MSLQTLFYSKVEIGDGIECTFLFSLLLEKTNEKVAVDQYSSIVELRGNRLTACIQDQGHLASLHVNLRFLPSST